MLVIVQRLCQGRLRSLHKTTPSLRAGVDATSKKITLRSDSHSDSLLSATTSRKKRTGSLENNNYLALVDDNLKRQMQASMGPLGLSEEDADMDTLAVQASNSSQVSTSKKVDLNSPSFPNTNVSVNTE